MTERTETESNRDTIRDAFQAWQDGTAVIADVFAADMVWRIEGHSLAAEEVPRQSGVHRRSTDAIRCPVRRR